MAVEEVLPLTCAAALALPCKVKVKKMEAVGARGEDEKSNDKVWRALGVWLDVGARGESVPVLLDRTSVRDDVGDVVACAAV